MRIEKPKSFRSWGFLACLLAVMAYSAFMGVGAETVHADSACTAQQCSDAYNYAGYTCFGLHLGLYYFACPLGGIANDDFRFICYDGYNEKDDCSTFGRS